MGGREHTGRTAEERKEQNQRRRCFARQKETGEKKITCIVHPFRALAKKSRKRRGSSSDRTSNEIVKAARIIRTFSLLVFPLSLSVPRLGKPSDNMIRML